MINLHHRLKASIAFFLAVLLCEALVVLFVPIDPDIPPMAVLAVQILVAPLGGLCGALLWNVEHIDAREAIWKGLGVLCLFLGMASAAGATLLGDFDNIWKWGGAYMYCCGMMVRTVGTALLGSFMMAGFLLSDEVEEDTVLCPHCGKDAGVVSR